MSSRNRWQLVKAAWLLGGLLTLAGGAILWDSWRQTSWMPLPGRILESSLVKSSERSTGERAARVYWRLSLSYAYTVGGHPFVGDGYASEPPGSPAEDDRPPAPAMTELASRYPVGADVVVYVDPSRPGQALLKPARSPSWSLLAAGLSLLIAGLALRSAGGA